MFSRQHVHSDAASTNAVAADGRRIGNSASLMSFVHVLFPYVLLCVVVYEAELGKRDGNYEG